MDPTDDAIKAMVLLSGARGVEARRMGRILPKDFRRASTESVCEVCSEPYWKHALDPEFLSWEDRPFLRRLCNGDLVKL